MSIKLYLICMKQHCLFEYAILYIYNTIPHLTQLSTLIYHDVKAHITSVPDVLKEKIIL